MNKRKLLLGMIPLLFIVTLLLIFFQLNAIADEQRTRSPELYVGSDSCKDCHASSYSGWNATHHPNAWLTLVNNSSKEEYCERCHVTGWNDTDHGGFDSGTDQPDYLKGIQCEACHGPGEDHVSKPSSFSMDVNLSAFVCGGACHQEEHHPYYEEWEASGHALSLVSLRGAAGVAQDSCLECHSADYILANESEKPTVGTARFPITCALCHDPHNAANPNQLRWPTDELCARCHNPEGAIPGDPIYHPQSSMRDGRSGAPVLGEPFMGDVQCADCHVYMNKPNNITGHSFTQKPEACVVCHSTVPPTYSLEQAETQIAEWRSQTWTRTIEVQQLIVLAQKAIEDAPDYGFPESTIEIAVDLYDEANYSLSFVVADGSAGAHNPSFTSDLLNFSEERSLELISLLTPGTLKGRVVDTVGNPVEGVTIENDGRVWATSKRNGTFEFLFAPGTHSFVLKLRGSYVGSIDSVIIVSAEVTDVGDIEIVEENLLVPIIIAIGVIVLLSIIIVYLLFKTRIKGPKKEDA